MFKVNRRRSGVFTSVSVVDFEQVSVGCVPLSFLQCQKLISWLFLPFLLLFLFANFHSVKSL